MSEKPNLPIRLTATAAELAAVAVREYSEAEARLRDEQTRKLNVILKDLGLPLTGKYIFVGKEDGVYVEEAKEGKEVLTGPWPGPEDRLPGD